jgi:erythronate-4-phosphate dehydrogenase
MKIVADSAIPFVEHFFSSLGKVVLCDGRNLSPADLTDADVLLVRTVTAVNRHLLEGTAVKFVGTATSGIDHIDTQYLHDNNISFAQALGCNARSVAEYVLSSLCVLAGENPAGLAGKTVGIIGCGHTGSALYNMLQQLGIRCLLNDPPLQLQGSSLPLQTIDEVLAADIISLHVPLVSHGEHATRNLLDRNRLAGLREDVILINASRGGVIDEQALIDFLDRTPQCAAVLDVWENEPVINAELLARATIVTPHIAGYSTDAKLGGTLMVFREACRVFEQDFDDSMIPVLPVPEPDHIFIGDDHLPLEAVQAAVLASYDVRTDSGVFRHMLDIRPEMRAGYFSGLRNRYPLRREFGAMKVVMNDITTDAGDLLRKTGFQIQTGMSGQ